MFLRSRLPLAVLTGFVLAFLFVSFFSHDVASLAPERYMPSIFRSSSPSTTTSPAPKPFLASVFKGAWVPRPRPTSSQIFAEYGTWSGCYARKEERFAGNRTEANIGESSAAGLERLEDIMSYDWVPQEGTMREWDGEAFVHDLLRSRVGLLFVGDSLTTQAFDSLSAMLTAAHPTSPEDKTPPLLLRSEPGGRLHLELRLNPEHPLYLRLSEQAASEPNAIPLARLSDPVATFLRADHLLPYPALSHLVSEELGLADWSIVKADRETAGEDWIKWLGHRLAFNSESLVRRGEVQSIMTGSDLGWKGEQDGYLILSTGPHWNVNGMALQNMTQVHQLYNATAQSTVSWLPNIPHMKTLYRATAPAHMDCHQYSAPITPTQLAENKELGRQGKNAAWGWDKFETFNQIWQDLILDQAEEDLSLDGALGSSDPRLASDGIYGRKLNERVGYLDVWDATLMRGDAHFLSPDGAGDCLHFCAPSLPWLWMRTIWHAMS